tara:strand:+ start:1853 stop:2038 length:186 start_codon:yes stop_codon:yes gene_type:complete
MLSGKNMPITPSVNFIMPLSIIDQGACTAPRVRPSFHYESYLFYFYVLALNPPIKQDAYYD